MTELNKAVIKRIVNKSETAEGFFTLLASRERCKARLDLRRIRQDMLAEGFKVVPEEFDETFRELAAAGMGKYIRKAGQPPRFQWSFSARDIATIALSERTVASHKPGPTEAVAADTEDLLQVVFPSGLVVGLPKGLTMAQIDAVVAIMRKNAR